MKARRRTSPNKIPVRTPRAITLKVTPYEIIEQAVYDAVQGGMERAYKYADKPSDEEKVEEIRKAVMLALDETLDFGEE